ncbi:MAG: LexA family transcriptional regulator [Shewanella sp.]|nr:LexA family transcriptional regulator [Shewanella sp.]
MINATLPEMPSDTFQSPSLRVKNVRLLLGLSRKKFEEVSGISAATLLTWETGKHPLSAKGAKKLVDALDKLNITCTADWLMSGKGLSPRFQQPSTECWKLDTRILKEVMFFEQNNPSPIVSIVCDDSMHPFYQLGDYVAGCQLRPDKADQLIGRDCIVTLETGQVVIRRVQQGKEGRLNLYSLNLETQAENTFISDCRIQRIAQVVWHRRFDAVSV